MIEGKKICGTYVNKVTSKWGGRWFGSNMHIQGHAEELEIS
jgi:hypothetical protein